MSAKIISFSAARGALYFCIALIALIAVPQVLGIPIGLLLALESATQSGFWNKMGLSLASITSFSFFLEDSPTLNLVLIGFLALFCALRNSAEKEQVWSNAFVNFGFVLGFLSWHMVVWYSTSETGIIWFVAAFALTLSSMALAIEGPPPSRS